jgi:hypothetical protein
MRSVIKSEFQPFEQPHRGNVILHAIRKFWEFSNFYGEYHSLDPSERRKFVLDKSKGVSRH